MTTSSLRLFQFGALLPVSLPAARLAAPGVVSHQPASRSPRPRLWVKRCINIVLLIWALMVWILVSAGIAFSLCAH